MENPEKERRYENIGPTAWGVAYHRTPSDIKYSKEFFDELDAAVKPANQAEVEYMESAKKANLAPQFEARYKLINRMLEENKTHQILELASGLAPRGLAMTETDPSLEYVELDLSAMAGNKQMLLKSLYAKGIAEEHPNLHVEDGDALNEHDLRNATQYFKDEPISVVNEGLMRYLNFDQKKVLARNIHSFLETFGGTWITSDITFKKILSYERQNNRQRILALSGIDVQANAFHNEEEAMAFFGDLGFNVERHSFLEVADELVSPEKVGLSKKEVEDMLKTAVVYVMRVKE